MVAINKQSFLHSSLNY